LKDKLEEIRHLPIKEKAKALKKLKEEVLERAEDVNMMLESQMTQKMTQEEKQDAIDTAEEAKKSR
jgi:acyl-CoA reductase-like NAD-dependent aldehyde dehydrogenase